MRVILFIGVPRSGTTVLFESFCHHEDMGWIPAQWRFLRNPSLTGLYFRCFTNQAWQFIRYKRQQGHKGGSSPFYKILPLSTEDYQFWQERLSVDMAHDFLLGREPSGSEADELHEWITCFLRWSGRSCFIHKFTGPGRIRFLRGIFPEAMFVHVVRDPIAVVRSLLSVPFWREGEGLRRPWWNGIPDPYLEVYRQRPVPEVLAAAQWKAIVDTTRKEARLLEQGRYREVRYRDFAADSAEVVQGVLRWAGLESSRRVSASLARRPIENRNRNPHLALEPEILTNLEWALSRL